MRFYWVRDRIRQNHFHIFYEEGRKKLADYVTKHHPIWQHITMRPRYLKETKKYTEDLKYQQTGTGRWCSGTNNTRVTRQPDNPHNGIQNPIPHNLDNTHKVIKNLSPNRICSQWTRGLNVPAYIYISFSNKLLIAICQWRLSNLLLTLQQEVLWENHHGMRLPFM